MYVFVVFLLHSSVSSSDCYCRLVFFCSCVQVELISVFQILIFIIIVIICGDWGRINEKDKTSGNTHQRTNICMSCNTNNTKTLQDLKDIFRNLWGHSHMTKQQCVWVCMGVYIDQISIEAEIKTYSTGKLARPRKIRQLILTVLRGADVLCEPNTNYL